MKVFFDTSVLVAVFWGDHPAHEAAISVFRSARRSSAFCAAHSMAELYAVMTRLPVRPAARRCGAERTYTLDRRDLAQLAADLAPRIRVLAGI